MTTLAKHTLVLGLGNPLRGDDGVGPAVIEWLRAAMRPVESKDPPPDVKVMDGGTRGLDLLLTLAEHRRVLIVDAADVGRAPGEWLRFVLSPALSPALSEGEGECAGEVEGAEAPALSAHSAGLADALTLGAAIGMLPEQTIIFGVQPARVDWSPGLSAEVQRAVPDVGRAILDELGWKRAQARHPHVVPSTTVRSQDGENTDH